MHCTANTSAAHFPTHRRVGGYTTIGVIMSIAIMGVLTAVSFPALTLTDSLRLRGASLQLLSDVRRAQQLAMSRHTRVGLYIDPVAERYYIYEGNIATYAIDPLTNQSAIIDYSSNSTWRGVEVLSTNFGFQVEFDALGRPYDSGGNLLTAAGQITLHNGALPNEIVVIEAQTGRCQRL